MQNAAQQTAVQQREEAAIPSAAVSYLDEFRPTEQSQSELKPAPAARPRSGARSAMPSLQALFERLLNNFGRDREGVFYIDHDHHKIRSTFAGEFEFEGTIKTPAGAMINGTTISPNAVIKSAGTVIIDAEADASCDIECETLIVLGSHTGKAVVRGTLINMGTIKGEYIYGALESLGRVEGKLEQIKS
ncbi:polymer-forming cytoskeletal protein [Cupriavidus sp. UYPR2.512]|uniref:polymer-forming cytoskeletal protein n=1 Tax=Cupriavidus sp. UYPR2.512 TaxID=1080187 RepID=UPI00037285B6|nr:polymer-forming cytoskeletal protein [Cupriavidus sp. UYPR2.512]UIF89426.1 polymer-forming cytoskeletal protein [Cupriavidus necator]